MLTGGEQAKGGKEGPAECVPGIILGYVLQVQLSKGLSYSIFGAQGKQTCYALNGQAFQPEVKGLRGLLRTYRCLQHVPAQ